MTLKESIKSFVIEESPDVYADGPEFSESGYSFNQVVDLIEQFIDKHNVEQNYMLILNDEADIIGIVPNVKGREQETKDLIKHAITNFEGVESIEFEDDIDLSKHLSTFKASWITKEFPSFQQRDTYEFSLSTVGIYQYNQ